MGDNLLPESRASVAPKGVKRDSHVGVGCEHSQAYVDKTMVRGSTVDRGQGKRGDQQIARFAERHSR